MEATGGGGGGAVLGEGRSLEAAGSGARQSGSGGGADWGEAVSRAEGGSREQGLGMGHLGQLNGLTGPFLLC